MNMVCGFFLFCVFLPNAYFARYRLVEALVMAAPNVTELDIRNGSTAFDGVAPLLLGLPLLRKVDLVTQQVQHLQLLCSVPELSEVCGRVSCSAEQTEHARELVQALQRRCSGASFHVSGI